MLESRAFTDREAANASPPLVDVVATDVPDLLRQLDGRTIKRFDGRPVVLQTRDADVRRVEMSRRQRFLGAIAHPQIAYLLLTLGMLGLTIELWNPGSILPGVAGGLSLLLAFFAFQVLPVNITGLLLIVFGVGLLVLELKVPSFGALGIGGAISLFIGSLMATRGVPGVHVGLGVILPAVIVLSVACCCSVAWHLRRSDSRRSPASTRSSASRRRHARQSLPARPVSWPSTANCGRQRAMFPSRLANSFASPR